MFVSFKDSLAEYQYPSTSQKEKKVLCCKKPHWDILRLKPFLCSLEAIPKVICISQVRTVKTQRSLASFCYLSKRIIRAILKISAILYKMLYMYFSFWLLYWELNHMIFLKLEKIELLAKLSKFTKWHLFSLKMTSKDYFEWK